MGNKLPAKIIRSQIPGRFLRTVHIFYPCIYFKKTKKSFALARQNSEKKLKKNNNNNKEHFQFNYVGLFFFIHVRRDKYSCRERNGFVVGEFGLFLNTRVYIDPVKIRSSSG